MTINSHGFYKFWGIDDRNIGVRIVSVKPRASVLFRVFRVNRGSFFGEPKGDPQNIRNTRNNTKVLHQDKLKLIGQHRTIGIATDYN